MENKQQKQSLPYVEFTVEGIPGVYAVEGTDQKGFHLTYDVNQIVEAEISTGLNLFSAMRNLDQMSAGQMRAITFSLLKGEHPKIVLKEAGELLSADPPALMDAIRKVLKVKSQDEAVLESIQRLAMQNPAVVLEMFARAGVVFTLGSEAAAPPSDSDTSQSPPPVQ